MGNRYAGSRGQQRPRRSLVGGEATTFRTNQRLMPITLIEGRGAHLGNAIRQLPRAREFAHSVEPSLVQR